MNLKPLVCPYTEGQYFRHIDGGYYQFEKSVYFADDQDELVIYKHLWPFELSSWARRYSEFKDKFFPITKAEYEISRKGDRDTLQKIIAHNKAARRNRKTV